MAVNTAAAGGGDAAAAVRAAAAIAATAYSLNSFHMRMFAEANEFDVKSQSVDRKKWQRKSQSTTNVPTKTIK